MRQRFVRSPCGAGTVLGLALTLLGSDAAAQSPLQPTNVVPNFDRIRVGQVEGLEGGAYVARTGNAGANWYNPAGLAMAEKTVINASANAYEYTTVSLEGLDQRFPSGRFSSLGTYFAGVIGSEVMGRSRLRLGFSFTRPVLWSPGAVSGVLGGVTPGSGGESLDFHFNSEMTVAIPALAAGYPLTDRLRVGVGVGLPITWLKAENRVGNRLVSPLQGEQAFQSASLDGQSYQLQATAGVQWEVSEALRLGATFTSPGLHLGGSSLASAQTFESDASGALDISFRDDGATFKYPLPMRIVGGFSASLGDFEVEANLRYHGSRDVFDMVHTEARATVVRTDADGTPTVVQEDVAPARETLSAVTNLALGGNYALAGSWRLHAGVFTDRSPVGNPDTSQFQTVDLTGFGLAVSFGGQLSGTIGVSSNWGTTLDRRFGPSLGGVEGTTEVNIRTFSLHYALSYTFQ
ncbi:MAG: hypothetical protein P8188_02355 [Gemmatimonadota bacterium]